MRIPLTILIALLLCLAAFAQDVKITASVDKNPVGENEQFTLEFEVSGSTQSLPDIEMPNLEYFAVINGPSVSSSYQIVNLI